MLGVFLQERGMSSSVATFNPSGKEDKAQICGTARTSVSRQHKQAPTTSWPQEHSLTEFWTYS